MAEVDQKKLGVVRHLLAQLERGEEYPRQTLPLALADLLGASFPSAESRARGGDTELWASTCAGGYSGTIRDLVHRLEVCVAEEQETALPRNHFVDVFCDVIRYMRAEGTMRFQLQCATDDLGALLARHREALRAAFGIPSPPSTKASEP